MEAVDVLLRDIIKTNHTLRSMIGMSAPMNELRRLIARVSLSDSAVLIIGESGSGKELVAEAIHNESSRRGGPFVAINCAALSASLVEAELFGFSKGGFAGAVRSHTGVFERAYGGTVFLDEITEMPLEVQSCLLRVLESRRITRLGSGIETKIDVRIVAATSRCPLQASKEGRLREDIYYRLAVFPILIPPLRQRGNDIQLLINHFLEQLNEKYGTNKSVSMELRKEFQGYSWPGNVRELANAMERAFMLAEQYITPIQLDSNTAVGDKESVTLPIGTRLTHAERLLIESTLRYYHGNRQKTADVLGCSLKTLYNKLQTYRGITAATDR
jgi:transcriptional regulator with PAS, ATPase and Fis domain